MSDLVDTTEMYLKTVYELTEEGIPPLRARIAERLGHSGPTVSQTVARMERDGLVVLGGDRQLELTAEGLARAVRVMRKHRLAERLLVDVIGLDWSLAHQEACRWEHVMSEPVERRLAALLDHPDRDPYGNPIPGLAELDAPDGQGSGGRGPVGQGPGRQGSEPGEPFGAPVASLAAWTSPAAVLARIGESVQVDVSLLERLAQAGIEPGATIAVSSGSGLVGVSLPVSGSRVDLSTDQARHLFVRAAQPAT
ncbi:MAG: metal-dependent transcriptional regulator [Micrococcales bacterium]|nr:metal-dependent transcriptional regulator [Micrococcales bacterium]